MKIARFRAGRRAAFGVVQGNEIVETRGSIYSRFRLTDNRFALGDVTLLPPTEPSAIWGPGVNFPDRVDAAASLRGDSSVPSLEYPEPWQKGRNSLTGPGNPIIIPKDSDGEVHFEGEAVAVIGKQCRRVAPDQAGRYILGYTCGNDVSERTWQKEDRTLWRAKGSDTFSPVGPWIETDVDPQQLELLVKLNGQEMSRSKTSSMIFPFSGIVSYISQHATLYPGDLVFSGGSGASRPMKPGDLVEVEIPGIGILSNPVTAEFDSSGE